MLAPVPGLSCLFGSDFGLEVSAQAELLPSAAARRIRALGRGTNAASQAGGHVRDQVGPEQKEQGKAGVHPPLAVLTLPAAVAALVGQQHFCPPGVPVLLPNRLEPVDRPDAFQGPEEIITLPRPLTKDRYFPFPRIIRVGNTACQGEQALGDGRVLVRIAQGFPRSLLP